ncbi:15300_t:CDS:1, partial [Funneliformis caledonium]
ENNDLSDINSDHDSIQSHYLQSASRERTSSPRLVSKKINERSKSSNSLRFDSRCSSPDQDEDIRMPWYLKSIDLPDDLWKALRI